MENIDAILDELPKGTPESAAAKLRGRDFEEREYFDVVATGFERDEADGKIALEGLLRSQPTGRVGKAVLRGACEHDDPRLRRRVVETYRERHRELDLMTGVGLLTSEDAGTVLGDFFDAGGSLHSVTEWLARISVGYRREKRAGNIDPDVDGWFKDRWEDIKDAGKSIGEAINSVVDAVVDAGKSFAEVVEDIVNYSQRRINAVVEALIDAGKTVADIVSGLANRAYSTIEKVVKGLISAGKQLSSILEEALAVGEALLEKAVKAMREAYESLTDIVVAAADVGAELVRKVARALVDMVTYASARVDSILEIITDHASHLLEEVVDELEDLVDAAYELAKGAVEEGVGAIVDQLEKAFNEVASTARSIVQGLLDAGAEIGQLLDLVRQNVSDFFEDAVQFVHEVVHDIEEVYEEALALGSDVLGEAMAAIQAAGESLRDVVEWARDAGEAAVNAVVDGLEQLGELTTDALYQLGKAVGELGQRIGDVVEQVIEWGQLAAEAAFDGLLAVGQSVGDLLATIYEDARDFIEDGIETLIDVGARIKDVLAAGLDIGLDVLGEFIAHLRDLGHAVWYILDWVVDSVQRLGEALEIAFEALLDIGEALGDLISWAVRRGVAIMERAFQALLAIGTGLGTILVTLLTDPGNVFGEAIQALRNIGTSLQELFEAVATTANQVIDRLLRALEAIGTALADMLSALVEAGKDIFVDLVERLLTVGVTIFEVLLWAIDRTFDVFGWVMEVIDAVVDSFLDVIEWAAGIGGEPLEWLADWFANAVSDSLDWIRDKVIAPLMAAGKLALVVALGLASLPFLAVAYVVLGSLVDASQTTFKHWPDTLHDFECLERLEIREIAPPAEDRGIVVFSDLHMEDQDDIDAGLGHFHVNADLVESILTEYASDEADDYDWTVVFNGDSEEFWADNDLTANEPDDKVDDIVATHPSVHETVSEDFYKFEEPRRFVKVRGNHDASYEDPHVVNAYESHGFPDLEVYDYLMTQYDGQDLLIMHGHQFDPYNCDPNNDFGKFSSNFVAEPVDVLSDTFEDVFGEDASLEGETVTVFGVDIPIHAIAPYYDQSEWQSIVDEDVKTPELTDNLMFDEHDVVDTIRDFDASMIIGHTHGPKLMTDSQDSSRFYVNSGTSGWWEGCVWTVEITEDNVTLNGWTEDGNGAAQKEYVIALDDPTDDGSFGEGDDDRLVTNATF